MDWQNATYALVQVAHNFGAVAVVGGPLFMLWPARPPPAFHVRRRLLALVLAGWALQAASGAAFGATSYWWYGALPDIHGPAVAALLVKVGCAVAGFLLAAALLAAALLRRDPGGSGGSGGSSGLRGSSGAPAGGDRPGLRGWGWLLAFGATALTAAAVLRWFS